jgi:hypothetical protein
MSVLSEALYGVPGISTTGAGLCVRGGVDHASEVAAMDGCENLGEAYGTDALEDEVEGEVDLRVLAVHLLGGDVDATAGGDDDVDGLIDGVRDGERVDVGRGMVSGGCDTEHVYGVH